MNSRVFVLGLMAFSSIFSIHSNSSMASPWDGDPGPFPTDPPTCFMEYVQTDREVARDVEVPCNPIDQVTALDDGSIARSHYVVRSLGLDGKCYGKIVYTTETPECVYN